MEHGLGSELPQRTGFAWLLLGFAVVMAIPTLQVVLRSAQASSQQRLLGLLMAAVMTLVLVLAPAMAARYLLRQHVYVSHEAVTLTTGERIRVQMRFADISQVRLTTEGGTGTTDPTSPRQVVVLTGTDATGQQRDLRVTAMFVRTIDPLLERVAAEVQRRPEILPESQRDTFTQWTR